LQATLFTTSQLVGVCTVQAYVYNNYNLVCIFEWVGKQPSSINLHSNANREPYLINAGMVVSVINFKQLAQNHYSTSYVARTALFVIFKDLDASLESSSSSKEDAAFVAARRDANEDPI